MVRCCTLDLSVHIAHIFGLQSNSCLTTNLRVFIVAGVGGKIGRLRFSQESNLLNSADFNLIFQIAMVLLRTDR